jgi:hypothetical protein
MMISPVPFLSEGPCGALFRLKSLARIRSTDWSISAYFQRRNACATRGIPSLCACGGDNGVLMVRYSRKRRADVDANRNREPAVIHRIAVAVASFQQVAI